MNEKNKSSISEHIETRRQYYRIWRAKNKDKIKQYNNNYWLRKTEKQRNDSK